jgi:spore germination protein YaaH
VKYSTIAGLLLIIFLSVFSSCSSNPALGDADREIPSEQDEFFDDTEELIELPPPGEALPVSTFSEIWAYVLAERESALADGMPISDIGYFGAEIDSSGKLTDVPRRRNLSRFPGRVHLVVACNSRALAHFVLAPGSAERKALIADLIAASADYDGLQIDFELILQKDAGAFLSFLAELRTGLKDKMFTAALPARTRRLNNDAFDYERIKPLVDRILVMAYDEHWSTSAPGPIASLSWCKNVAGYALRTIGPEKLIMGIPFYGRSWGSVNGNRAFYHSGIERIKRENGVAEVGREENIPTFSYEVSMKITVYYDDDLSLSARMEMYRSQGVRSVGFWSIGQETPGVWNILELSQSTLD